MNRTERNNARKNLGRNLIAGTLFLFLLGLSIAGATGAWFTNGSISLQNIFTAGTVMIDVTEPNTSFHNEDGSFSGDTSVVPHDGYIHKSFNIENVGTKSTYIRAYFEGYWDRLYHKNTATVTATSISGDVEDNDSVHFYYESEVPNPYVGYNPKYGFTAFYYNLPYTEIKFGDPEGIENDTNNDNGDNGSGDGNSPCTYNDFNTWPYRDLNNITTPPLSGRDIEPVTAISESLNINPTRPDPHPDYLEFPAECKEIYYYKVNDSKIPEKAIKFTWDEIEEKWITDENFGLTDSSFSVSIFEAENEYISFKSNYSVYNLYVKGGPSGFLYSYFLNPAGEPNYPSGVTSDCWLTQIRNNNNYSSGDWSHASFYYCKQEPDPSIEIIKEVLFNGEWLASDQTPITVYNGTNVPQFRFIVKNTGNVVLNDVKVTDDVLDLNPGNPNDRVWRVGTLYPKDEAELDSDKVYYDTLILDSLGDWWSDFLSTEHVVIKLCDTGTSNDHSHGSYDSNKWVPQLEQKLPVYFYHTEKLTNSDGENQTVDLCVKIYIEEGYENLYKGSTLIINSYFEAVQASNNMILENWEDDLGDLQETESGWWNN